MAESSAAATANAEAQSNFTEFEVRSSRKDSRRYHCGRFPKTSTASQEEAAPQPDFSKEFLPPIYMRYEEFKARMTPEEAAEEAALEEAKANMTYMERRRATGGFRRPFIRKRKEYQWVMEDNSRKHKYEGKEEARESARYVVLVPPTEGGEVFRVIPVEKWFNFKKPPAFQALSTDEAENAMNEKGLAGFKRLQSIKKTLVDSEGALNTGDKKWSDGARKAALLGETLAPSTGAEGAEGASAQPRFNMGRGQANQAGSGRPGSAPQAAGDDDAGNEEEDIFEKAIDRNMRGGQGGGDFEYEFDDDDDDGAQNTMQAIDEDAEQLEKGAEGFREANEEDEVAQEDGDVLEEDLDAEELEGEEQARLRELEELRKAADDDENEEEEDQTIELYNKLYTKQFFNPKRKKQEEAKKAEADAAATSAKPGATGVGSNTTEQQQNASKTATTAKSSSSTATASGSNSTPKKRPLSAAASRPDPKKQKSDDLRNQLNEQIVNFLRRRGRASTTSVIQHLRSIPPFDSMDGLLLVQLLKQASVEVANMTTDVVEGPVMVLKSQFK